MRSGRRRCTEPKSSTRVDASLGGVYRYSRSGFCAVLIFIALLLAACQPPPKDAVTGFAVGYTVRTATFEPGQILEFSVHFDPSDQDEHGLPESVEFVADNTVRATAFATMEAWVGRTELEQRIPWDCFGPIEVRDGNDDLLFTMRDIYRANSTLIRISGDLDAGRDVSWSYRIPGDTPTFSVPDREQSDPQP